ncbi:hypothetical protein [Phenylobacterium sp.]|uniref:hypothetical protein n=1 Tax=Phenylobacterium sp. TaxID=1871053 RepID=UPI0035B04B5D
MTSTPLAFPVLAFAPDVGRHAMPGRERLDYFLDEEGFSTCTSWDLEYGSRQGMLLADCAGRCWRIVRVEDLGVTRGFWERVLRFLLQQSVHRISQEIVEEPALSLVDLKERVCASIAANPDDWRDDEVIAGEAGPPRDEQELLGELQAAVRKAETLPQLINALYNEDLPG